MSSLTTKRSNRTSPFVGHVTRQGRDATFPSMPYPIRLHVQPLDLAQRLLREADAELFAGHHAAAERLAHRAAELRGWGA